MSLRVVNLSITDFKVDAADHDGMLDDRETFLDRLIVYCFGNSRAVDYLVMVVKLSGRRDDDDGLRVGGQVELLAVKDTAALQRCVGLGLSDRVRVRVWDAINPQGRVRV